MSEKNNKEKAFLCAVGWWFVALLWGLITVLIVQMVDEHKKGKQAITVDNVISLGKQVIDDVSSQQILYDHETGDVESSDLNHAQVSDVDEVVELVESTVEAIETLAEAVDDENLNVSEAGEILSDALTATKNIVAAGEEYVKDIENVKDVADAVKVIEKNVQNLKFRGEINGSAVRMNLVVTGAVVNGTYYYEKSGSANKITLAGTCTLKDGKADNFSLTEPAGRGTVHRLKFNYSSGNKLIGTFYHANGRHYTINLNRQ